MTDLTTTERVMPEADARRLTEKIRLTAHTYTEAREKLIGYVEEAKSGSAHLALGYASWTGYLADVLGEEPMRLARDERREVVQLLAGEGMSTRAIAPIVGASQRTVASDAQVSNSAHLDPDQPALADGSSEIVKLTGPNSVHSPGPAVDLANVDMETGEIHDEPVRKVTGMDGKTYTRPAPKPAPVRTVDAKKGTDLYALQNVIVPALEAWADLWTNKTLLDDTVTAEEATQLLRDLSRTTPVLSQIRRLLNSRMEPTK